MSWLDETSEHAKVMRCHREHREHWVVIQRNCNFSAFSGYHETPSDYSAVQCQMTGCFRIWRTKAAYVETLRDGSYLRWSNARLLAIVGAW